MGGKFIHDLEDANKSIFSKFTDNIKVTGGVDTDDTKVTGGIDTYEAGIILQIDLNKLEEGANKNYMKFSKDK